MNLREKQVYDNSLKAIDEIIQQKPDMLVHAGDLFDVVKPKPQDRRLEYGSRELSGFLLTSIYAGAFLLPYPFYPPLPTGHL